MKDRVKLSELNNKEMLFIGDTVTTKEDFLGDFEYFKNVTKDIQNEVYTTTIYTAYMDARQMLESAIEREAEHMHESWSYDIVNDITEQDIEDIQLVIDRILKRNEDCNICYQSDRQVELDIDKVEKNMNNMENNMTNEQIKGSLFFIDGETYVADSPVGTGEHSWYARNILTDKTIFFTTKLIIEKIRSYDEDLKALKMKQEKARKMFNLIVRMSEKILSKEILAEEEWSAEDISLMKSMANGDFNIEEE